MFISVNQLQLHVEVNGAGPPLLLLHGFTGSAASWNRLSAQLAPTRRTIAVDLIGHGQSAAPADPARYGMERCVADLLALLDTLEIQQTELLGYSMGGRVALQLAAAAPERIRALVLESSSPGLGDPAERQARRAADEALAESIEREGLAAFVERWEQLPLFASQAALPAAARARQRAQRMQNNPVGLANSLRGMGTGQQSSLWLRLPDLGIRTLLVAGELDQKYSAIGRQMAAALPNAQLSSVPGTGHAVHLEQPAVFATLVRDFLLAD